MDISDNPKSTVLESSKIFPVEKIIIFAFLVLKGIFLEVFIFTYLRTYLLYFYINIHETIYKNRSM